MNLAMLQGASFQEVQPDGRVLMPPYYRDVCNFRVEGKENTEQPGPLFILRPVATADPDASVTDLVSLVHYDPRGWIELSPALIERFQRAAACLVIVGQGEYFEVWLDRDWIQIQKPVRR